MERNGLVASKPKRMIRMQCKKVSPIPIEAALLASSAFCSPSLLAMTELIPTPTPTESDRTIFWSG